MGDGYMINPNRKRNEIIKIQKRMVQLEGEQKITPSGYPTFMLAGVVMQLAHQAITIARIPIDYSDVLDVTMIG